MWVMACTTLQTFIVMHFTSPDISTEHTDMEAQVETALWREKMVVRCQGPRGLGSVLTSAKKVSRVLPEKIPSHIVIVNETRPHDLVRL